MLHATLPLPKADPEARNLFFFAVEQQAEVSREAYVYNAIAYAASYLSRTDITYSYLRERLTSRDELDSMLNELFMGMLNAEFKPDFGLISGALIVSCDWVRAHNTRCKNN